jgi:hypothetical protein
MKSSAIMAVVRLFSDNIAISEFFMAYLFPLKETASPPAFYEFEGFNICYAVANIHDVF